jgi:hypothetical protein
MKWALIELDDVYGCKQIPGCSAEYNNAEKRVVWTIRKFAGGSELGLRIKITLDQPVAAAHKREVLGIVNDGGSRFYGLYSFRLVPLQCPSRYPPIMCRS